MANPHPNTSGLRRGQSPGRTPGIPNKTTQQVKRFLDRVFTQAFADERFEQRLVKEIVEGSIDSRVFGLLLAHYVGRPSQAVDLTHSGTVSLADIIAGRVPKDDEDEDDADGAAGDEEWHGSGPPQAEVPGRRP